MCIGELGGNISLYIGYYALRWLVLSILTIYQIPVEPNPPEPLMLGGSLKGLLLYKALGSKKGVTTLTNVALTVC